MSPEFQSRHALRIPVVPASPSPSSYVVSSPRRIPVYVTPNDYPQPPISIPPELRTPAPRGPTISTPAPYNDTITHAIPIYTTSDSQPSISPELYIPPASRFSSDFGVIDDVFGGPSNYQRSFIGTSASPTPNPSGMELVDDSAVTEEEDLALDFEEAASLFISETIHMVERGELLPTPVADATVTSILAEAERSVVDEKRETQPSTSLKRLDPAPTNRTITSVVPARATLAG
ncbi:hypothetical protein K438DRAFT_467702 [Mycena galopus ATCC 62051]|nr:hypothetical protein K438DRAFT_467702 [Mycena galopus ATCC 62051]